MPDKPEKMDGDVRKIADVLRLASEQDVVELEVSIPFFDSYKTGNFIELKARWKK